MRVILSPFTPLDGPESEAKGGEERASAADDDSVREMVWLLDAEEGPVRRIALGVVGALANTAEGREQLARSGIADRLLTLVEDASLAAPCLAALNRLCRDERCVARLPVPKLMAVLGRRVADDAFPCRRELLVVFANVARFPAVVTEKRFSDALDFASLLRIANKRTPLRRRAAAPAADRAESLEEAAAAAEGAAGGAGLPLKGDADEFAPLLLAVANLCAVESCRRRVLRLLEGAPGRALLASALSGLRAGPGARRLGAAILLHNLHGATEAFRAGAAGPQLLPAASAADDRQRAAFRDALLTDGGLAEAARAFAEASAGQHPELAAGLNELRRQGGGGGGGGEGNRSEALDAAGEAAGGADDAADAAAAFTGGAPAAVLLPTCAASQAKAGAAGRPGVEAAPRRVAPGAVEDESLVADGKG